MSDDKPWEDYKSDNPEVLAEKAKTAKIKAAALAKPKAPMPPAKPKGATDAWDKAFKLKERQELIAKATKPLRKLATGTEE